MEEDNGIEVEDPESSNNSSIVEAVEMQLQAIESDESLWWDTRYPRTPPDSNLDF